MACYPEPNNQQTARSLHVDGVHVCMADGSVRWISDYIQIFPSSMSAGANPPTTYKANFSVWDRLISSADGQQIAADAF